MTMFNTPRILRYTYLPYLQKTGLLVFNLIAGLILPFFLLLANNGFGQAQQVFTTTNTFTVPAGITQVTVEAWGGGGRGGTRTSNGAGGGGGGGAYARKVVTVTPGNTYTVNVGAGSNSTAAGGDSWFINNTTILAKGGLSVPDNTLAGANGGAAGSSIGDVVFSGGNGATGNTAGTDWGGGGGSSAGTSANGVNATTVAGALAPAGGGNGGAGFNGNDGDGNPGVAPGGGGGGATRTGGTENGGSGANGQVIITIYPATQTFNTSGTFTVPAGVTAINVQAWGGGGGGGNYNPNEAVGGGGGGAYASRNLAVVPLTTYTVTVGGGGGVGVAGGASWFNMNSLVDVNSIVAAGGGTNTTNRNGGAGGTVANSNGTTRYAGGQGGDGRDNGGGGGGGGSALITANGGDGNDGGGTNGGTGGTGTGNGGNGGDEDGTPNAVAGNSPGGGGGGRGDDAGTSAAGAPGQIIVNYALPANYQALFTNMDYGSGNWCQGETRQITVSVTNTGALPWPDASPDINIGVKWNADADYFVRVNAGGLAAGASQTFSLTITAPNIAGANNLSFDVVKEGDCWFGNNNGSCGPGNSVYISPAITIGADAVPTINAGTDIFTCSSTGAVNITAGSSSSIANINWSSPDATGIFVDDGSLTTATFTPDAADIAAGWRTIELLAENASCSVTDSKIITITPAPTIDDLVASSVCSNETNPIVFSAAAVADNYSALNWTTNGAHPSGVVNPSSLNTAEYTLDPADIGSVSFTLTATGNTGCGNEMKTKVINIIPEPVPVAGLPMTYFVNY